MRLWHYKLLPYLPKSQLIAQKCECDLIWKDISNGKQTNHILINYIWKYSEKDRNLRLASYYYLLEKEFSKRGFKFKDNCPVLIYETELYNNPFYEHKEEYMLQCFFNLEEKYQRGQKDFDWHTFDNLYEFVNKELDGLLDTIYRKLPLPF